MKDLDKKLKIVVTGTRGVPDMQGGVETHCRELYPRITQQGFDVTIIRRKAYVTDRLQAYQGVRLYDVRCVRKKAFEALFHTFHAVCIARWKLHADVIHIHSVGPALLTPFARLFGLKVVFTHHGPDYNRDKWGCVAKAALRFGERMGCKLAHEVIVISDVINDIIQKKYGRRDAHLIYNGVSEPVIVNDTAYLDSLQITSKKYIFAMGRFVPEKNFHLLIEAFSRIAPQGFRLVIAGDSDVADDYAKRLKALAKEKGVILTGFIQGDPLHTLLSHAALFVLPSSHEGLPIALLEAMSYRLPILASDIPANLAVCLPPSCYFRYDYNPLENLIDSLQQKLLSPTSPFYDLSAYNWNHIATQTASIYQNLQKSR